MSDALILFARLPEPGSVKSRLGASIGPDGACRIYTAFLEDLLSRYPHAIVAVEPAEACAEFEERFGAVSTLPQRGSNLGDRLDGAVREALRTHDRVCVIGSDLPHLPPETVREAFDSLERHDVVLGPAADGGYYLVALRSEAPIFDGIEWSSRRVMDQTLAHAARANLNVKILRVMSDIDTIDDLAAEVEHLLDPTLPHTRSAVEQLLESRPALFDGGDL